MTAPFAPGGERRAVQHLNAMTLWNLPAWSAAPDGLSAQVEALRARGVEAIQHPTPEEMGPIALPVAAMARIDRPEDADRVARAHVEAGYLLTTLHVGTGFEDTDEAEALLRPVIEASDRHGHPMMVETHRATVTQDIRRTLDLIDRLPDLRFNADLSHWYTGHEMTYGDVEAKAARLRPVFDRVRYLHGRIGSPCVMQEALRGAGDDREFVRHHRLLLRMACEGFARTAGPGEVLPFAAELLPYEVPQGEDTQRFYYARVGTDGAEETDRWAQAEILWAVFAACAREAGLAAPRS